MRTQHLPYSLGNVTECVDSSSADSFLVGLKQLKQLKTDPHPLSGWHKLCSTVGDTAHQVNAVLLHFLMSETITSHQLNKDFIWFVLFNDT